jgi:hypothetical protein
MQLAKQSRKIEKGGRQSKRRQEGGQCLVCRAVEQENMGHEEKHEIDGRKRGMSSAEEK